MTKDQLTTTLVEISTKLAVIEVAVQDLRQDMKEHRVEAKVLDQKLDHVEKEIAQARGSVKMLKWMSGVALALPAVIFAVIRIYITTV